MKLHIQQYEEGAIYAHGDIVANMPNEAYHKHPGISNSGLKKIEQSPAHYKYAEPSDPTRNMEIGTAIHTAILEPERFNSEYILLPECEDRRSPEYKSAVKAVGNSELVLVGKEVVRVTGMRDSIYSSEYLKTRLSESGMTELSLFANDPETGVLCKVRFDRLTNDFKAIDLKKTQDARAFMFSKAVYNYGYHHQAAFYSDVFEWCAGEKLQSFEFLVVEEKSPHGRKMYKLDEPSEMQGRIEYRTNLDEYAECKASNNFYSYPAEETELIGLPDWVFSKADDDIIDSLV